MPRPRSLTSSVQKSIVSAIRKGATQGDAAVEAGVSRGTVSVWMRRGSEELDSPFAGFREAVLAARAKTA